MLSRSNTRLLQEHDAYHCANTSHHGKEFKHRLLERRVLWKGEGKRFKMMSGTLTLTLRDLPIHALFPNRLSNLKKLGQDGDSGNVNKTASREEKNKGCKSAQFATEQSNKSAEHGANGCCQLQEDCLALGAARLHQNCKISYFMGDLADKGKSECGQPEGAPIHTRVSDAS